MNYFEKLNSINVNEMTERKGNLTYLSWAHAWRELKKLYPRSFYTVYPNEKGWFYHTDGRTAWVKTGVTVVTDDCEIEHIEYLPVMDFKNKSIPYEMVTSFDVNKTIQRSLTKAVARHGLGLYVYAGEDLPSDDDESVQDRAAAGNEKITQAEAKTIKELIELNGKSLPKMLAYYGIENVQDMTKAQYANCFEMLKGKG